MLIWTLLSLLSVLFTTKSVVIRGSTTVAALDEPGEKDEVLIDRKIRFIVNKKVCEGLKPFILDYRQADGRESLVILRATADEETPCEDRSQPGLPSLSQPRKA
jgi:Fe-S cluster assembly iron-binding protein IscA